MLLNDHKKWYPVYTNPRAEKKAFEQLQKKGITCYLPLQKTLKQWSDRKKWVEEPLLKSYIFVFTALSEQQLVLQTPGISRFIYFSGKIATVPEKQLDDLKLLLLTEQDLEVSSEIFETGEKVEIKAGTLKGMSGELVNHRGNQKFIVRLQHLGYSILVEISAKMLIKV